MPTIELKLPKMGESISEATILNWLKNEGDTIEADETILEVATDKVDSEVPAPCDGTIVEIKCEANEVVAIGSVIAIIEPSGNHTPKTENKEEAVAQKADIPNKNKKGQSFKLKNTHDPDAFLSPLVISIAKKEGLTIEEVQSIEGSGAEGRIRKSDVIAYIKNRK